MLGQTFAISDIPQLIALIFIEILLSTDNALILAAVVQPLPIALRRKALLIGSASALVLRGAAIAAASFMLKYLWLQLLGAAYLFYLCIHHFFFTKKNELSPRPLHSLWKTVLLIELLDITFAMDSVIAGIAFIINPTSGTGYEYLHPKLWIVYFGGITGLLAIRYAAGLFSGLMDRFPRLSDSAYLLVGWVGLKLTLSILTPNIPYFETIFWAVFSLLFLSSFLRKRI